jgi:uncharacterized protein
VAHAYLVWPSDILVAYALCGLVVYLFRRVSPVWLTVWGLAAVSVPSLIYLAAGATMPTWPPELTEGIRSDWAPLPSQMTSELEAYRGGWLAQMQHRAPTALVMQTLVFAIWTGWRAAGLMLIGMALLKWRILSAERTAKTYAIMLVVGSALGLPLIVTGLLRNFAEGWAMTYSMFIGWQFNYWGSVFVAFAYVAAVMLLVKSGWMQRASHALAAVGKTALTNYLGQSLLCTMVFYGHGLGLFGKVERWQQLLVVLAAWTLQVILSVAWLRHFRFGPMEWLWRSLTYLRWQPLRVPKPGVPASIVAAG